MDLAVMFEDSDSTEPFLVLDMDKYDLILGMPWLEKHEPWIDWRGKAIGASRPAVFDRALVSNVPTSVRDWGARDGRQGAYAPEEPEITGQVGNIGPQEAEAAEESAEGVSSVGNIGPPMGNDAVEENAEGVSGVGNIIQRKVEDIQSKNVSTICVCNVVLRRVKKTIPHSESETPPARPVEYQYHVFGSVSGRQVKAGAVHLEALSEVSALLNLEELSMKDFLAELKAGDIAEMVLLKPETSPEDLNFSSVMDEDVLEGFTKQRATRLGCEILKNPEDPVHPLVKEYSDVVSKHPPSQLQSDRGVRHEIDLVPGTKYCVTRQWPLPREYYDVIDAFFADKAKSGMVQESKSPYSTPTFCVRKPNGNWRLVHAYNKLNNATVPAQTPIPRKDVLLNNMSGCTLYSALDLVDIYYQILMRESDIPLTAVRTPSGMLWEWLVMPQGLSNAPATFNRMITQLIRPLRTFAQTYLDDIIVHSRVGDGQTAVKVHLKRLRRVFEVMRANKLYANIDKRTEEIKVLGCFVSRVGVRADPGKVKAIAAWPTPRSQKDLRKWLGLAYYLHKYSTGYAQLARPLSDLLKKDADWVREQQHQYAFDSIKASLQQAPVLALPDENKSFSVVCDASDYAIGCALLQKDDEGHERVISFQSRQLKAAERNYPVHDKELLAMKYALVKFRVHLLGTRPFVIYTDHASLRTATNSPHLSQRMARWLSFFAEYNFRVEYKPGKLNVLADALSRRPDYGLAHVSRVTTDLYDRIRLAYQEDENYTPLVQFLSDGKDAKVDRLSPRQRAQIHRYELADGPGDPPRVVVPNDEDLKYGILPEAHDAAISGLLGREKTYQMVSQTFWWPRMYEGFKHRFIGPFAVLARHGTACTIDLPKSRATHSTFSVGVLSGTSPSPRTEGGQGERSPPRNEAESSEQPELPVSDPVNETQAGTSVRHTKGMKGTDCEALA
ncbi:Putative retroelement [Phytophthora palmivora]|uniref:RNA-directed DNA polymerase n=1 Tax=Phytophthora palmivora TaxID=4796 RepID=A0A2P4XEJ2_9STRA|nr:Putative retroelement [Phytophthora palmivora]